MPDYAIVNLLEIDDDVQGRVPGMEGRFSRKFLGSRDLGVSHWKYAPDLRSPGAHSHREQEEAYVVVSGSGRVRISDAPRSLSRSISGSGRLEAGGRSYTRRDGDHRRRAAAD